jgi:BlaR1 peptidase M56/Gram-negative bacterial TonB protein C-terminal
MLTYLLQVNLCWGLFYGLYYALLSRETFFKLNRIYLIISLLCGLVIPLSSAFFSVKEDSSTVILLEPFVVSANLLQQRLAQAETWSMWRVLTILYGIGGLVLGIHFMVGLLRILSIYRSGEKTNLSDFILVITVDEGNPDTGGKGVFNPFSFFRWVFFNPTAIQKDDFQQIILHEKAHVIQKHSYDVVFLELLKIAFWWSPLIWFYKKSLINVHEYLADEAVLETTTPPQYGRLLLRQMQVNVQPALANNFISQLKKRIIMMSKNRSSKKAMLKYALFLPIFITIGSFIVACSKDAKNDSIETQVDVMPEFVGGQQAMIKYLTDNIKYPEDAKKNFTQGTTYLEFVVEKDGSISNIGVKSSALPPSVDTVQTVNPTTYEVQTKIIMNVGNDILDKEAIRVVQAMPKWAVGKKNGQAVRTEFVLPVKFELEKEKANPTINVKSGAVDTIIQIDPVTLKQTVKIVKSN